jgi:hypothetical protein
MLKKVAVPQTLELIKKEMVTKRPKLTNTDRSKGIPPVHRLYNAFADVFGGMGGWDMDQILE